MKLTKRFTVLIIMISFVCLNMPLSYAQDSEPITVNRAIAIEMAKENSNIHKQFNQTISEAKRAYDIAYQQSQEAKGFYNDIEDMRRLLGDDFPSELNFSSDDQYMLFYLPQLALPPVYERYLSVLIEAEVYENTIIQAVDHMMNRYFKALSEERLAILALEQMLVSEAETYHAYTSGTLPEQSIWQARIDVNTTRIQLELAKLEKANADMQLRSYLGISDTVTVVWVDDYIKLKPLDIPSYEEAIQQAFAQRKDIERLENAVKTADAILALNNQFYYNNTLRPSARLQKNAAEHALNEARFHLDVEIKHALLSVNEAKSAFESSANLFKQAVSVEASLKASINRTNEALRQAELVKEKRYAHMLEQYKAYTLATHYLQMALDKGPAYQ